MAERIETNPRKKRRNPGAIQDLSLLLVGTAAAVWLYAQAKAKAIF